MTMRGEKMLAGIRVCDYFIPPAGAGRRYYFDSKGVCRKSIDFLGHTANVQYSINNKRAYRLSDFDGGGTWLADWLLVQEPDGSLTEWGDDYPAKTLDWPRDRAHLRFVKGHEIQWAEHSSGTLWPSFLKSTPSQFGSFGTFLCVAMKSNKDPAVLDIYMEQKFRRTDRAVYHCRAGYGIEAITYYTDGGDSITIKEGTWV
jgi:hypothetical protein